MQQQTVDAAQERSRLIDHFKRAYQIIVGLAITLACTKLFPNDDPSIPWDTSFWLFCIFFITVVPIFHGGDRSLDVKYLRAPAVGFWGRAAYIWDVYMLLITAILFVKIAQAIPGPRCWAERRAAAGEVCETIPGITSPVRHFACRAGARSQRSPRHHVFMDASGSSSRKLRTPRQFLYSRLAVPRAGF